MNTKKEKDRRVDRVMISLTATEKKKLLKAAKEAHMLPSSLAYQWVSRALEVM